jgi:hypothetical protein
MTDDKDIMRLPVSITEHVAYLLMMDIAERIRWPLPPWMSGR